MNFIFLNYKRSGKWSGCVNFFLKLTQWNEMIHFAIVEFLEWTFITTFPRLIFLFIILFFMWVILFATLMWISTEYYPSCIAGGESFWQDAFALSWTTFSTVGYGHIYPTLAGDDSRKKFIECGWLISLCSIESFVGVLYAGFCGAILFSKIYRVQTMANIAFSKAIVVRYGNSVQPGLLHSASGDSFYDSNEVDEEVGIEKKESKIECPVMSFRVVNEFGE